MPPITNMDIQWPAALPLLVLALTPIVILLVDLVVLHREPHVPLALAVLGMLATIVILVHFPPDQPVAFNGFVRYDTIGLWGGVIALTSGILVALISPRTIRLYDLPPAEYYALLTFAAFGMVLLCVAFELLTIFIAIEIIAISFYVMIGLVRGSARASEAALKYFILSSFSTAFMIFGFAFLYAAAEGSTLVGHLARTMFQGPSPPWLTMGLALVAAAFAFKLTLAPFHLYAADVFEGAPTPVAAFLATGSKIAGFVAFIHLLLPVRAIPAMAELTGETVVLGLPAKLMYIFWALAALSIVVGNAVALLQRNIKRMLAYSSIAHSGYLLIVAILLVQGAPKYAQIESAALIYMFAYVVMSVAAFGVASTLGESGERNIDDYAGLWKRSPGLALVMTIAMLSLTGIPVTAGFIGKFYLFYAGVQGGLVGLVILAVLGSAVSAYYYLRVVVMMYMRDPSPDAPVERVSFLQGFGLFLAAATIIAVGIVPQWLLELIAIRIGDV